MIRMGGLERECIHLNEADESRVRPEKNLRTFMRSSVILGLLVALSSLWDDGERL